MGWDKEKNVQFIIATEATGKFCELQNTLQMSSAFPVYSVGQLSSFVLACDRAGHLGPRPSDRRLSPQAIQLELEKR